jgi:hypothetical protein
MKKKAILTLEPPANFADPRLKRSFKPEFWPLCNGAPSPGPKASDLYDRRCVEFLAAYYKLNVLSSRLLAVKGKSAPERNRRKRLLALIEQASTALEKLEDRYTPVGFYGQPTMDGVFYRDIHFVRPAVPRIFAAPQSSHIAIPGLEHIPASELRGPVRVFRFGHGKTDL